MRYRSGSRQTTTTIVYGAGMARIIIEPISDNAAVVLMLVKVLMSQYRNEYLAEYRIHQRKRELQVYLFDILRETRRKLVTSPFCVAF